jgi:hypothetical protein
MGNSESKNVQEQTFYSEHPHFSDARLVINKEDGSKYIQGRFKVQNEQYDEWHKLLDGGNSKLKSDYLLLPEKTNYKHDHGLCGNTGTLTVSICLSRTTTPTTPTRFKNSYCSASLMASYSRRASFGMSSSLYPLPSEISGNVHPSWVTSSQRISL